MREAPIKLGPLAMLLTVISICMTTLAILSFSTARADARLAETYAETVSRRYELEVRGQELLAELDGALRAGDTALLAGMEQDEEQIYWTEIQEENARLRIGVTVQEDGCRVAAWRQERDWQPDESMDRLWDGN